MRIISIIIIFTFWTTVSIAQVGYECYIRDSQEEKIPYESVGELYKTIFEYISSPQFLDSVNLSYGHIPSEVINEYYLNRSFVIDPLTRRESTCWYFAPDVQSLPPWDSLVNVGFYLDSSLNYLFQTDTSLINRSIDLKSINKPIQSNFHKLMDTKTTNNKIIKLHFSNIITQSDTVFISVVIEFYYLKNAEWVELFTEAPLFKLTKCEFDNRWDLLKMYYILLNKGDIQYNYKLSKDSLRKPKPEETRFKGGADFWFVFDINTDGCSN